MLTNQKQEPMEEKTHPNPVNAFDATGEKSAVY